jgi:amidase
MRRLSREKYIYELTADNAPAYEVDLGETVIVEVWDAFAGRHTVRRDEKDDETRANPATGPIYVRGLEPGDIMAIEIMEIKPVGQGILNSGSGWKILHIDNGAVIYSETLSIPLRPMIGVIGVAPAEGILDSRTPSDQGGNMDTNDVCAGSTLCLTAQVPGALLALGDVHAYMGEGESNGMGIEVAADIMLRIDKWDENLSSRPFIVREDALISIASEDTLDNAAWKAVEEMRMIVMSALDVDEDEARLLVGLLGNVRVSQIVNPKKTARVEMPLVRTASGWEISSFACLKLYQLPNSATNCCPRE